MFFNEGVEDGCDPVFRDGVELVDGGLDRLQEYVSSKIEENWTDGPSTRASRRESS